MYEKIKQLCKKKGITISQLESELEFAKSSLHKIDKHKPNLKKLQKIADYFGVSIDSLMYGEAKVDFSTDYAIRLADLMKDDKFKDLAEIYVEIDSEIGKERFLEMAKVYKKMLEDIK